jgi:tetratricopeptide (TPR) repeat protein
MSAPAQGLCFTPYEQDGSVEGRFHPLDDESWQMLLDQFDEANEAHQDGHLPSDAFVSQCKAILKREPGFLDAYAHIGHVFMEEEDVPAAGRWYKKGLAIALPLIPKGFAGTIRWGDLDNRPFLRVHHGVLLCALRLGRLKSAIAHMEEHLRWNPDDNIGVRYLLGDAYLAAKQIDKAREVIEAYAREYPPYRYSLGLIEFQAGRLVEAATALRQGFATNPYIAEALTGRVMLQKHCYWHPTSRMAPETAVDYLELLGMKNWVAVGDSIAFVDWLFNCSAILQERADTAAAREALSYEGDFQKRSAIVELDRSMLTNIDDSLSRTLIRKVTNPRGQQCWPWDRDAWK